MDLVRYTKESIEHTLQFAQELGEKEILVVFKKADKNDAKTLSELQKKTTLHLQAALLLENPNKAPKNYVLLGVANRTCIDHPKTKYLIWGEEGKDKTHHRAGLNHVEAKLISEKKKTYLFDLSTLIGKKKAGRTLGRMQHNKKLLTKYGAQMKVVSNAQESLGLRAEKEREHILQHL